MPGRVAARAKQLLDQHGSTNRDVLLLGMAYKPNIDDTRGSVALDVASELMRAGLNVLYHDPHVESVMIDGVRLTSQPLSRSLVEQAGCAVVLCAHDAIDFGMVAENAAFVVDPTAKLAADGTRVFAL
jgi:UDP-N-acetyl-D-glucosamine dehydrogenase